MSSHKPIALCLLLLVLCRHASAGVGSLGGSEEGVFAAGGCSVIVGKVDRVWQSKAPDDSGDGTRDFVSLVPLATLAGTFDPSLHPTMTFQFYLGRPTSSVKVAPKRGDTVICVVRLQVHLGPERDPRNVIVAEFCTFMPGESAMVTVKGPQDPVVMETLKRIQVARARRPEKDDAERPAGQPENATTDPERADPKK